MTINIESVGMLIVATLIGTGVFTKALPSSSASFNYNEASTQERAAFLKTAATKAIGQFRPNFVVQNGTHKIGGRSISLTYNVGMGKIDCDTEETCKVMQCRRYLNSALSKQNISVLIKYQSHKGKRLGSQMLKNDACETEIAKWDKRRV